MVAAVDSPTEPQPTPVNSTATPAAAAANVDEPVMTEEQRNARAAIRNNNARNQLIPRSDLPETATRRPAPREVIERSNSPVIDDDDDESK